MDVHDSPDEVLDLLRKQTALYGKLEGLAARQRTFLTGEDTGPLLTVLADRRKLVGALNEIAVRLEPVRRGWANFRQRFATDRRTEAERLLHETSERLQRVIRSDEEDVRVLCGRRQTVAESLRATHCTSEALSAYRAPVRESRRVDCTSGEA